MKIVLANDSFKGTMSSSRVSQLLIEASNAVFGNATRCVSLPLSDGGEGAMSVMAEALNGTIHYTTVCDPLMRPFEAPFCTLPNGDAIVEMACASGLGLVPADKRDPMLTSTFGTGQLISKALDMGAQNIYVTLGGSATNDGGMGCMSALGARFLDDNGNAMAGTGQNLIKVKTIDTSGLDYRLRRAKIIAMCDVSNVLCGANGATHTFARQKGADDATTAALEQGMCNYRDCLTRTFGRNPDCTPGTGAAGGLGAALQIMTGAEYQSGIEVMLSLTGFDNIIRDADLVITGEGRIDRQSAMGKVVSGVARHCAAQHVKVWVLAGTRGDGWHSLLAQGVSKVYAVTDFFSYDQAMAQPEQTYYRTAVNVMQQLKLNKLEKTL